MERIMSQYCYNSIRADIRSVKQALSRGVSVMSEKLLAKCLVFVLHFAVDELLSVESLPRRHRSRGTANMVVKVQVEDTQ